MSHRPRLQAAKAGKAAEADFGTPSAMCAAAEANGEDACHAFDAADTAAVLISSIERPTPFSGLLWSVAVGARTGGRAM
jgi:hypothetical protein